MMEAKVKFIEEEKKNHENFVGYVVLLRVKSIDGTKKEVKKRIEALLEKED